MKLSKRLQQIVDLVTPGYTHIWDCCCDHGLLGAALLSRGAAEHIHFVDILPDLISAVEHKLQQFHSHASAPATWHTHCLDVAALPLQHYAGRQLVIIAGVGGDLMTRFIQALHRTGPAAELDFLLCPVHQEFSLRQQLIASGCALKAERLIRDNGRFYEILLVSAMPDAATGHQPITPAGDAIWHADTAQQAALAREYLAKTLRHYQNIRAGGREEVQHIIDAYRAVRIQPEARGCR